MKRLPFFIAFTFAVASWPPSSGLLHIAAEETLSPPTVLDAKMEQAWEVTWGRFFQKDVQTFADYLSSYEAGKELSHLPTAEEVRRQYPNPCGYGTGMEDGMILGGAMLSMMTDMYAVTEDESLRDSAAKVYSGVRRCATAHGVPGFLARNVCRDDRTSIYINSSRDQYTHGVHGLWKFYRSSLSDDVTKDEIRNILAAVADRMIQFVTPQNDYDFCRADGTRCPLGICRMWHVQAHEAARLPMIYAAAWDVTGDEKYERQWRTYVAKAVEQSTNPDQNTPAYAILQMQCSLELLFQLEPDDELKTKMNKVMQHLAAIAEKRSEQVSAQLANKTAEEMKMLGPDWRTVDNWINQNGYPNPQWGPYRQVWHLTREAGEAAMVPLMVDHPAISADQKKRLQDLILNTDYAHNSSCGIIYHLAAYWKARLTGSL